VKARLESEARRRPAEASPSGVVGGTGFVVAPALVVTNNHVVAEGKKIQCFIGEESIEARVIASDKDADLALLRLTQPVDSDVRPFLLLETSRVMQGQRVYAMGYQITDVLGTKLSVHEGTVSSLSGFEGRSSQFQIEMSVHPGSSGGPLLDSSGRVLGVVMGKLGLGYLLSTGDVPQGVMFAVKVDILRPVASTAGVLDQRAFLMHPKSDRSREITALCKKRSPHRSVDDQRQLVWSLMNFRNSLQRYRLYQGDVRFAMLAPSNGPLTKSSTISSTKTWFVLARKNSYAALMISECQSSPYKRLVTVVAFQRPGTFRCQSESVHETQEQFLLLPIDQPRR
jgi:V8-like Glu-specific endopeptidase